MPHQDRPSAGLNGPQPADPGTSFAFTVSPLFTKLTPGRRDAVYQTLTERMNTVIVLLGPDTRVIFATFSLPTVAGYQAEAVVGKRWRDLVHADDAVAFGKAWKRLLAGGTVANFQIRVKGPRDEPAWLELEAENKLDDPQTGAVVMVVRNVSKRMRIEEELREAESRWRFLAESMPTLIFAIGPDGHMEYANPQWQEFSGVPVDKFMRERSAQDAIIHPEDRRGFWKAWRTAFRRGRPFIHQFRLRRKDGTHRWHICRIQPMKADDGSVRMWVGSCTDTEDLYQAMLGRHEFELQAARLDVQRQELLALNQSKDEFISLASHQLRTPATGVKQFLGMLLQGFAGEISRDQRAFLQTAYDSNERQIAIVNDLLRVAQIDTGRLRLSLRKSNLVRLVKKAINEHAGRAAGRGQEIMLKASEPSVMARVDSEMFRMALDNVVDNAIKYGPPGSRIIISITYDKRNGAAVVAVTDQGEGMTSQEVGKIFNKFSRLENPLTKSVDGSGLGLYWAKRVLDLHGGGIKVRSKPGRGTTFSLWLPRVPAVKPV